MRFAGGEVVVRLRIIPDGPNEHATTIIALVSPDLHVHTCISGKFWEWISEADQWLHATQLLDARLKSKCWVKHFQFYFGS